MFTPVPPDTDFVALEQAELARWSAHRVFERSIEQRKGSPAWVFYEGPPTANGMPGLHHVWARVYKDLFCRFRTMEGNYVARRAGWDTHGLPVEVEVEKKLGITGKRQIEEQVGIAEFTRLCRESVYSYVGEFARLTERIGYWVDMDAAYWTLSPDYIESVWWHLQQLFDQGLLYEDLKVVPYCPRCGTALSSHELGQPDVYGDEEDESAYVRFRLVGRRRASRRATRAVVGRVDDHAVDPALQHGRGGRTPSSPTPWSTTWSWPRNWSTPSSATGRARGSRPGCPDRRWSVCTTSAPSTIWPRRTARTGGASCRPTYVTTEEGTGLVHLAPAFGEVDRQIGREHGLPSLNPVGPDGRFTDDISWLAGREVRAANHDINDALEAKGLLVRRHPYVHSYPHCWRCGTPLIYWGKPSWYIATSTRKDDLLAEKPPSTGTRPTSVTAGSASGWPTTSTGRSRATASGVRRCRSGAAGAGHVRCVGSLAELSDLAGRDVTDIDPHRPAIDDVTFACSDVCGRRLRRRARPCSAGSSR